MKLIDLINKYTVEEIAECWQKIHPEKDCDADNLISSLAVAIGDLKNENTRGENAETFDLSVERFSDRFCGPYIHVSLINKKFVKEIPLGLKTWGGNDSDEHDCPEGYCNINWLGYHQYLGFGRDWDGFIDGEIVVHENASDLTELETLTEILWEITFYGFSRKSVDQFWNVIYDKMEECKVKKPKLKLKAKNNKKTKK